MITAVLSGNPRETQFIELFVDDRYTGRFWGEPELDVEEEDRGAMITIETPEGKMLGYIHPDKVETKEANLV